MAQKKCKQCKNCILHPAMQHVGMVSVCRFDNEISLLPTEKLLVRIINNECDWYEAGTPEKSVEPHYHDFC